MPTTSGGFLGAVYLLSCVGTPLGLPEQAFVASPCSTRQPWHLRGDSRLCGRAASLRVGVPVLERGFASERIGVGGIVAGVEMRVGNGLNLPDLIGRMIVRDNGDVGAQRDELNRLHLAREEAVERIKRKMRAASYNFGGQDWCRLFSHFDSDNSGMIDFEEFEALCRHMGLQPNHMGVEEMLIVFDEVDVERRGFIEVVDFSRWLSRSTYEYPVLPAKVVLDRITEQGIPKEQLGTKGPVMRVGDKVAWSYGAVSQALSRPVPDEIPHNAASYSSIHTGTKSGSKDERASAALLAVRSGDPYLGAVDLLVREIKSFADVREDKLRKIVYFLLNEIGLSKSKVMGLAIAAPGVFSMDLEGDLRPQIDYLLEIGVPNTRIRKMIVSFPQLLELSQDKKEATVKFFENLGMPLHSVGKCLSQQPQLLGLSLEAKLQPTVNFLICECRIPADRIGHLIATFPTILAYSIEGTLAPRLAFIREELKVPRHKLAPLLLKFPQLLGLSIETNMQPTIKYLTSEIGIPETEISKIVQQHPQILGLSVEANLKPKISFLLEEIGVPYERLARIVASFPTLLSLSIDSNLRPKVEYLCNEGGFSREDILKAPHLLAYSLKQRMQPRIEFMRSNGTKLALHSILCLSNQAFARRFDDYRPVTQQ